MKSLARNHVTCFLYVRDECLYGTMKAVYSQFLVGDSHGKFVVEEELEVDL
jgi:hypothetical protein